MKKVRVDEVFCRDCFKYYHWSQLKLEDDGVRKHGSGQIIDWVLDPEGHVVGIMQDDPRTPTDEQVKASLERIRAR